MIAPQVTTDDDETPRSVRDANRLKVLEVLFRRPGSTRLDLAEHTRLSRPTVSTLLDELERAGVVVPAEAPEEAPRGAGRPPMLLGLAPGAACAVGLDVGHTHVRAAVVDLAGRLLADDFASAEVDHAPEATLELAATMIARTLKRAGVAAEDAVGIGMAIAAPVDGATGEVFSEGILASWGGVRPADEIAERTGLAVRLENDANLGALGERTFGAGRGVDDMAYVRLSSGIGLGLILDGRPYRGATGFAGELGHIRAEPGGELCRCGKHGCLETVASPVAIAAGRRTFAEAGDATGAALAIVVNVLNPSLVVIGGEMAAPGGEPLLEAIRAALQRDAVAPSAAAVEVRPGTLGERAEVLGAAGSVLERAPAWLARRLAAVAG